jgi:hypothetical protein
MFDCEIVSFTRYELVMHICELMLWSCEFVNLCSSCAIVMQLQVIYIELLVLA